MLALRLVALIERTLRRLESPSAVDAAKLREVRALLAAAQRATQTPRQRLLAAVRPLPDPKPRAPVKTVARNRSAHRAAPDHAVHRIVEVARHESAPRQPHPAAIRREDAAIARRR
jgi:hypothetical protein